MRSATSYSLERYVVIGLGLANPSPSPGPNPSPNPNPNTNQADTPRAFARFSQDGAPLVAPIIQIILSRAPDAAKAWVDTICSWPFETVIPAHFDSPIKATPATLRKAFAFLEKGENTVRFCDEDVARAEILTGCG